MRRTLFIIIILAIASVKDTKYSFNELLTNDNELSPIETKKADARPKDTSKLI
ncbi:hypothetical protein BpHYR1_021955, partial [Brachionus plicatilis]